LFSIRSKVFFQEGGIKKPPDFGGLGGKGRKKKIGAVKKEGERGQAGKRKKVFMKI